MNCADIEILLADYQDGTLAADEKSAIESHLSTCKACEELARDVAGAVAFMGRASEIAAPPELVTRILFEISSGPSHTVVKPSWFRRIFGNRIGGKFMEPILQPRYAMGMAFTLLSFAMLGRSRGESRSRASRWPISIRSRSGPRPRIALRAPGRGA